jgi:hypothetical protein
MANTAAMADNKTRPMGMEESDRLLLLKNINFSGENGTYEIHADKRIGIGGESQVYLANRMSDGEQVVAKIYDEFADTPLNRGNRKSIVAFLKQNSDYKKTHIMPLLDNGNISMESDDGEDFSKPVDIIPYCEKSTLKKCDYLQLKNKVIPDILHALNLLHISNLVHRDIKPNNIYELNGEIVLSDFGTTSKILDSGSAEKTGTQRGTLGYTAPEISDRYFAIASDYYSLGCTIASLYKGEHVYQRLLDSNDASKLNMAMRRDRLPLGCSEAEADLQTLVDSLVMPDEKMRAGYDDVMLWINNSRLFVGKWRYKRPQDAEKPPLEFTFNGKIYNTETELTNAMLEQWGDAKRYLYRGIVADFFKQKNPTLADKTIDVVEKEATHNQDLGLAMFLHYLNTSGKPQCPIYWQGNAYDSLSDISSAISGGKADEGCIITMLKDRFLSWKYRKENAGEAAIGAIAEIENITESYPELGYYIFMYRCAPAKDKLNLTPDDVFMSFTENKNNWYKQAEETIKNDRILACLFSLGYKNDVLAIKKNITGKFVSDDNICDLMLLYQLFESVCDNKTSVREHYLHYGPQSYLYWFQQNLTLYSFNSADSKAIKKKINDVRIDEKMPISDIFSGFSSLKRILRDFMPLFQNNYLLTYMGLHTGKDISGITTKNTHAFFAGDFYGIKVPVGYMKSIGILK